MPRFATKDDLKSLAQSAKQKYAAASHTHTVVNGHTVLSDVPADAVFTDTTYQAMTAAELEAGTSTDARTISPKVLADALGSSGGGGATVTLMTQAQYDALSSPTSGVLYCTYTPSSDPDPVSEPAYSIIVAGLTAQLLSLTTDGTYHPNTTSKVTEAMAGDTVTFRLDTGYTYTVSSGGGALTVTSLGSQVYSFTMPESDVTINVGEPGPV